MRGIPIFSPFEKGDPTAGGEGFYNFFCGSYIEKNFMFSIIQKNGLSRRGILKTAHGKIRTPFFMPIATRGAVKNLSVEDLKKIGAQIVLSNTYHLWLKPGDETIKQAGGLHKFMNWRRPILTDSGGFQVFSLGKFARFSEDGVEFKNPANGDKRLLTPEKSIEIQLNLGADIIMCFDECIPWDCSYEYAKNSVERTTRWARRCKNYFAEKIDIKKKKRPLIFGIVQGNKFEDLRKKSALNLVEIGFDGYAIGGADTVHGTHEEMIRTLKMALDFLPEDKPRYYMGAGKPEDIVAAVALGVDMFDCVIPTRNARHGSLFINKISLLDEEGLGEVFQKNFPLFKGGLKGDFYHTIQITNSKFKTDFSPISENCDCYACKNYSKAYIRHLIDIKESLGMKLSTIHNLKFYLKLMKMLRGEK
ncbi:MAG: tRNA guanosine(34) transglycosylase Tgt [bacterium]